MITRGTVESEPYPLYRYHEATATEPAYEEFWDGTATEASNYDQFQYTRLDSQERAARQREMVPESMNHLEECKDFRQVNI